MSGLNERSAADDGFFRSIVEAASDLVLVLGERGTIEYSNAAATRILGYSPEEVRGLHVLDFVHEEDREAAARAMMEEYSGKNELPVLDVRVKAKDGRWVMLEGKVWLMPGTSPPRLAMIARDLGERARAAGYVVDREAWAHTVLAASPVSIVTLDTALHVTEWNSMAARIFGWEAAEARGHVHPALPTEHEDPVLLREVVEAGKTFVDQKARRKRRDGSLIEVSVAIAPIRRLDGSIAGLVEFAADVTAQRAVERQFDRAQRLEAIGRIARGVSRDLERTLSVIVSNSEALLDTGELRVVGRAHAILEESRRAATFAAQLGDLGGRPRADDSETTVDDVAGALVVAARRDAPNAVVKQSLNARNVRVRLSSDRLREILDQLLINAIEATKGAGVLAISSTLETYDASSAAAHGVTAGEYVVISIADSGPGVTSLTHDRAFEPFYTTKDGAMHSGLGLPRALAATRSVGGNVSLENQPDGGAIATVVIPIRTRARAVTPARTSGESEPVTAPGGSPRPRVIVLDDDPAHRAFTRHVLEAEGFKVLEAANAGEVRSHAGAQTPHLLVTPIVLPEMTGRELARNVRSLHPELKVLYVSSGLSGGATGNLGAHDALIAKPFTAGGLLTTVQLLRDLER
jgi:two-component system cell cycle sensor histidine kinase/response regulator CckA